MEVGNIYHSHEPVLIHRRSNVRNCQSRNTAKTFCASLNFPRCAFSVEKLVAESLRSFLRFVISHCFCFA